MGFTNVAKTYVGVPKLTGGIYRYPTSTVMPTTAYATRPGGGTFLGGVDDSGYTYHSERATDKKKDWNGDKVRSIQTSKDDTFEVTYIEFLNSNVMAEVFGNANVTVVASSAAHGTHIATKSLADVLGHNGYIIDTFDGTVKRRRVIPDAQVDKMDPIAEKPGDWAVYKLTYDIYPDSQGATSYTYTELGDVWVPSSWTVVVAGGAGTVIYTVEYPSGTTASTSAQAYNVATATLDTQLELLATVGSSNATVTGTPPSYAITLANGGVLTAVGSGGATATVTAVP